MVDSDFIDQFFADLNKGLSVRDFLSKLDAVTNSIRIAGFTKQHRLGSGKFKKLADEIRPVARYCRLHLMEQDRVSFALDSSYPDCVVSKNGCSFDVEVTLADALKRHHLMRELNEAGRGRGYVAVDELAGRQAFKSAMSECARSYSTAEVVDIVFRDLLKCAERKSRHTGDVLLIELDLQALPLSRYEEHLSHFASAVKALQFDTVYMTGRTDQGDSCLQLKNTGNTPEK